MSRTPPPFDYLYKNHKSWNGPANHQTPLEKTQLNVTLTTNQLPFDELKKVRVSDDNKLNKSMSGKKNIRASLKI